MNYSVHKFNYENTVKYIALSILKWCFNNIKTKKLHSGNYKQQFISGVYILIFLILLYINKCQCKNSSQYTII